MGECNTILNAYTKYRHLGQCCTNPSKCLAHLSHLTVVTAKTSTLEVWEILFTTRAKMGHGILTGSAYITGWFLALILIPMVVCSMSIIRRTGHFQVPLSANVFLITHRLVCNI